MTDHDIKARLEAHKAHVAELGWSRDVPATTSRCCRRGVRNQRY